MLRQIKRRIIIIIIIIISHAFCSCLMIVSWVLLALLVASKNLGVSEGHTKTLVLWKNKRKKERKESGPFFPIRLFVQSNQILH
jgi:hypothetical protein